MSGVHHKHCVELKSNRGTRLDVADGRQKQRCEAFAVAKTLPDPGANLFQEFRARRVLEQTHERLDRRIEPNDPGIYLRLRGRDWLHTGEERKLAVTEEGAGGLEEAAPVHQFTRLKCMLHRRATWRQTCGAASVASPSAHARSTLVTLRRTAATRSADSRRERPQAGIEREYAFHRDIDSHLFRS